MGEISTSCVVLPPEIIPGTVWEGLPAVPGPEVGSMSITVPHDLVDRVASLSMTIWRGPLQGASRLVELFVDTAGVVWVPHSMHDNPTRL